MSDQPDEDAGLWRHDHDVCGGTQQLWCSRRQSDRRTQPSTTRCREDVKATVFTGSTD